MSVLGRLEPKGLPSSIDAARVYAYEYYFEFFTSRGLVDRVVGCLKLGDVEEKKKVLIFNNYILI